ncbi:MAG: DUF5719 family protein, partial [Candidatus Geothermincolia bacterium]
GAYKAEGLPTGSYKVQFVPQDGVHLGEWYNDKPDQASADAVSVTAPNETTNINASLMVGASISGTVTEHGTGTPLEYCYVYAYVPGQSSALDSAVTDATGDYTLSGLPTGNYEVYFDPYDGTHLDEWYSGKTSRDNADQVAVTAPNETANINAALMVGGTLSGTVTEAGTGTPIAGCRVECYVGSTGQLIGNRTTNASGNYSFAGLHGTAYKLGFIPNDGVHLTRWYNNKANASAGNWIAVTPPNVVTANQQLEVGGSLSGTVVEQGSGTPLQNVGVSVYDSSTGNVVSYDSTDASGDYLVKPLASGSYKVQFTPQDGVHLPQWYNNKPDEAGADPVAVTQPNETPGINASLAVGAKVSGTVTEEGTGTPIAGCSVDIHDAATGQEVKWTETDASGDYLATGLQSGSYKVGFYPNDSVHLGEWYNNKGDQSSADPVPLTAPNETTGISAQLTVGATVSGCVTEEGTADPIANCYIYAYSNEGWAQFYGQTNASGNYTIQNMPTGNYRICFSPNDSVHVAEWYNDKRDYDTADLLAITAPSSTANIDASLVRGGTIRGTVTDESTGDPIENVYVSAYDTSTGNYVRSNYTDSSGNYSLTQLLSGTYKVQFEAYSTDYLAEWYNGKSSLDTADPVAVTAPNETTSINASLRTGGKITGIVTEEGTGDPLQSVWVQVVDSSSGAYVTGANTDASGQYVAGPVDTGSYKVQFGIWDGIHCAEWYNDKPDQDGADPVGVTAPGTTGNINASLQVGGKIKGTVTVEGTGTPLNGILVQAQSTSSGDPLQSAYTNSSGDYTLTLLRTGSYKVWFQCGDGIHLSEYYNGKSTFATADPVSVNAPLETTGINASLLTAARITGTVTDQATGNPIQYCRVLAYDSTGADYVGCQTDASGNYSLHPLETGGYRIAFVPADGTHLSEWYNNKGSQGAADVVQATVPDVTQDIDAALTTGTEPWAILSCNPATGSTGSTMDVDIVGSGTHFTRTSQATFSPAGIHTNDVSVQDATHITANITIAGDAAPGPRDVNVTGLGETPTPLIAGFNVLGTPAIVGCIPGAAGQGQTLDVSITGSNTHFQAGVSAATFSGTGITVNSTTVTDQTHATANVSVGAGAALGARNVNVITGAETPAALAGGFTVNAAPSITSISPTYSSQGMTINVAIVGTNTHFQAGVSAATFSGTGITVNSTSVTNATHATANITIAAGATPGTRNVNVVTGAETPAALANGFEVRATSNKPAKPILYGPATSSNGKACIWGSTDKADALIEIFDGAPGTNKIGETRTNAYGNYDLELSGLAAGTHNLYAVATFLGSASDPSTALRILVSSAVPATVNAVALVDGNQYSRNANGIIMIPAASGSMIEVRVWFNRDPDTATVRFKGTTYNLFKSEAGYFSGTLSGWSWSRGTSDGTLYFSSNDKTYTEPLLEVTLIDPSGYVYDTATGERVQGATVTLEKKTGSTWAAWPAEEYLQVNPMRTDSLGQYGWNTESGTFRVKVTKDGFGSVTSRTVSVPPLVTDLNVGIQRDSAYSFYFAEGCTRAGFEEWICIMNPGSQAANVTITYMLGTGQNQEQKLTVGPMSRSTVSVNGAVGPEQDVSALVSSDQLIIAERPMYFNYQGKWTGGHDVVGATSPMNIWYLAEGCTRAGFDEWICIQNPGDTDAQVQITYMLNTGANKTQSLTVNKKSRGTISVNAAVGPDLDVSAKVVSLNNVPIIVERPIYFSYQSRWTGGHDVIGASTAKTTWYFAEGCTRDGFEEWLSIQNPGDGPATVTLTYMPGSGSNIQKQVTVAAMSRSTVSVNTDVGQGKDISCTVQADRPIICERPMYFAYQAKWDGGHDVVGALYSKSLYFLAEGCTRPGFDEWISIQNPNESPVDIQVTYMLGTGATVQKAYKADAKSRITLNVLSDVGPNQDVSTKITSTGGNIIVERPMYFDYHGWTGGHDVLGF